MKKKKIKSLRGFVCCMNKNQILALAKTSSDEKNHNAIANIKIISNNCWRLIYQINDDTPILIHVDDDGIVYQDLKHIEVDFCRKLAGYRRLGHTVKFAKAISPDGKEIKLKIK